MSKELPHHSDRMPGVMIGLGVLFALIFTLIFLMIEQAVAGLKARRRKAVFLEPLDYEVPRSRLLGNLRPRIGK